jgi:hypothetical protein
MGEGVVRIPNTVRLSRGEKAGRKNFFPWRKTKILILFFLFVSHLSLLSEKKTMHYS